MKAFFTTLIIYFYCIVMVVAQPFDNEEYTWPNQFNRSATYGITDRIDNEKKEDFDSSIKKSEWNLRTDENNNFLTDSTISLNYDYTTYEITKGKKKTYTYDRRGFKAEYKEYHWNLLTDSWDPFDFEQYDYDGFGNQILRLMQHWNENRAQKHRFGKPALVRMEASGLHYRSRKVGRSKSQKVVLHTSHRLSARQVLPPDGNEVR
jgi:hypothetical protein